LMACFLISSSVAISLPSVVVRGDSPLLLRIVYRAELRRQRRRAGGASWRPRSSGGLVAFGGQGCRLMRRR
jgi:hypothetical protein